MITALLFLAAAPAQSAVCQKLAHDFEQNERSFAIIHGMQQSFYDAENKYADAMAPYHESLIRLGSYQGLADSRAESSKLEKSRADMEASDHEYTDKGAQITSLLIANKCAPPTHVTSWTTYASK